MIAATATPLTTGRVHGRVGRASPIAAHAAPNTGSAAGAVDTLSSVANPQKDNGRAGNWSSPKSLLPIHGEVARSAGGAAENPYLPPFVSRCFTPFLPIHGEVARSAGGAAENPYLPPFVSRCFTPFLPIHGEVARSAGGAAENPYLPPFVSRCFTPFLPIHGEVARSAGGAAENPYLPPFVCGLWGTVRFRGGRRPACSGFTFSPSPSLRLARPAVAWRVRSFARRSFLAARAVFRASESWVSFMGTTRSRASSSRTSTSARVSSRSIVLDTVILFYTDQSY